MLNNPHTIRTEFPVLWSGLYQVKSLYPCQKHLAWLLCSGNIHGRLATKEAPFTCIRPIPLSCALRNSAFGLQVRVISRQYTYIRLVLSVFPSCFQMPVVFYRSVIHGLGFFTALLSNGLAIFDSFIFVNDCMAMLRNTLMGSSKWGEKYRLV